MMKNLRTGILKKSKNNTKMIRERKIRKREEKERNTKRKHLERDLH